MKASLFDFSFSAVDSSERNLTFAFVLELKEILSLENLKRGALAAFDSYPQSNCRLEAYEWIPDTTPFDLKVRKVKSADEVHSAIQEHMESFLDVKKKRGVDLLVLEKPESMILVAKFHHANCDGISALLWLDVLLSGKKVKALPLTLKTSEGRAKKSKFSSGQKSRPFGKIRQEQSSTRDWIYFDIKRPEGEMNHKEFTFNDLLSAVLLKSMEQWNERRSLPPSGLSLYIPLNIRKNPYQGFGNGASRIKIYAPESKALMMRDYCSYIREQIRWCKLNGLWSVPDIMKKLKKLPRIVSQGMFVLMAKLPSSDFCSMLFSHMEKQEGIEFLKDIKSMEIIAPLIKQYAMSVVGFTQGDTTRLTITWDASSLNKAEVEEFAGLVKTEFAEAALK